MRFHPGWVTVAVPATSANLGPGFDSLGLALTLEDEVSARVSGDGFHVEVTGEGAGEVPTGEDHLIIATMLRTFNVLGVDRPAGLELRCTNRIPHARGLGSSSAAIVAGISLAQALVVDSAAGLSEEAVLRLASHIEGHPDNVAPCLLGGFTIAWMEKRGARAVRIEPAPVIRPTVYIPTTRSSTADARAVLPSSVPHADAAFNVARAALLVHALNADPSLLFAATEDRLHQQYRAPGMPETAALLTYLRQARVAAFVSGAGPSVLALSEAPEAPEGWCARSLSVCSTGARILTARHAEGDPVAAGPPS